MPEPVLRVENLVKRYGDVEAVRGVSFSVNEGEVFGLLGPNGAGKTSTIEILEGLRNADSGTAVVCGYNPATDADALKHEIGAALQSTALPDKLRVMEALKLFSSFYKRHRQPEELLKRFGLEEKRNAFYGQLSGGQKQRLALAIALINDPKVIFLDEPTDACVGATDRSPAAPVRADSKPQYPAAVARVDLIRRVNPGIATT